MLWPQILRDHLCTAWDVYIDQSSGNAAGDSERQGGTDPQV